MPVEQVKMDDKRIKGLVDDIMAKRDDPFRIDNKDSSKAYYYGNLDKRRLEMLKAQGWEVEGDKNLKTRADKTTSQHILGDVILMSRPKEISEEIKRRRVEDGKKRIGKNRDMLREDISRLGKGIKFFESEEDTEK